ncbi:MAG: transcriptional repressor NrdR [Anaerolineae bacterium]|jgi:transcriptional repressor NrdR|nr:transcriptional repressor NrdR [Anaerolineae bacterium]
MKCPYCDAENQSRVISTTHDLQGGIRRRRECKACERRFSTYEKVLRATPLLIKSNGEREAFDREKLIRGIQISCAKRAIPAADINELVDRIETHLQNMGRDEVSSRVVGDMVIEGLKGLDPIAYIRYAIVYLGLDDLASVRDMLNTLLAEQNSDTPAANVSSDASAGPNEQTPDAAQEHSPEAAPTAD